MISKSYCLGQTHVKTKKLSIFNCIFTKKCKTNNNNKQPTSTSQEQNFFNLPLCNLMFSYYALTPAVLSLYKRRAVWLTLSVPFFPQTRCKLPFIFQSSLQWSGGETRNFACSAKETKHLIILSLASFISSFWGITRRWIYWFVYLQ